MLNELGMEIKEYNLLDEGTYDAVIIGVVNTGLHPVKFKGEKKMPASYIRVVLEIPAITNDEGESATVQKRIKLTSHVEKGKFAEVLKALGEKVDKNTIMGYLTHKGLEKLLGKTCTITIDHFETDKGKRNAVGNISRLDPRLEQPKASRKLFCFNPFKPDIAVFKNDVTAFTQKEVMTALNSDNYPPELHEAWAEIQETDKATSSLSSDTSAIE